MEPKIVSKDAFTVVGLELPDGDRRSYLIIHMWIALCPRLHEIKHQVEPDILYGLWRIKPGETVPSYVVGVQVSAASHVPAGMVAVTVPASRYITLTHKGSMGGIVDTYQAIMKYMKDSGAVHHDAATIEIYDTKQVVADDYCVPVLEPIK